MTRSLLTLNPFFVLPLFFLLRNLAGHSQDQVTAPDSLRERMIMVGNHRLFTIEKGAENAKITVVFESGAGGGAKDWLKVMTLLSPGIRMLAYDRAGTGKSEAGPVPQTMTQNVLELHEMMKAAKVKGPIILVGQSLGGLIVRMYTKTYGENIEGLVFVDPTYEGAMLGSMKYGGWVRLREKAIGQPIPSPQLKNKLSAGYDSTADYMAEEFQLLYLSNLKNPQSLGSRPLIVIGAGIRKQPPGTPDNQWKELRTERDNQIDSMKFLSSNATVIVDPKSGHFIQNDNPEIVAKAIHTIFNAITSKDER